MNNRRSAALFAALASVFYVLAGCSASSEVSLTGNTPTQYSHVWITVQEVWFNAGSTAGPGEGGWKKFSLSTPSTVDLVAQNGGNLARIAGGLHMEPGTYSQVLLVPVDASAPLATSAQNAGAIYNAEADYVDSAGTTHQLPLELLSPTTGLGIQTSLKVPVGNIGKALTSTTLGTTTGTTSTTTGTSGTTTGTGLGIGTTSGTTGKTSTSTTPPNSFVVTFDGTSDLVPFNYASNTPGILLSSHATAYDLSVSGAISGQLTLTNITTSSSGLPAIQVSAETLSADGTRHVVVSSTTVQADGSFMLYPLATNSSTTNPQTYDVVIHGPGIATVIIKSVQVPRSASTSTTTSSTTASSTTTPSSTTTASSTTTPSSTNTAATATTPAVTPVSIGTLTPRSANSYTASISTAAGSPLPAGARVEFYQTLARQGEVPYVIETSAIDPFNQVLFNPQTLSAATVDSGTWSASGGAITLVSAAPAEGTGTYDVAGVAPSFNDGQLTPQVTAPASGSGPVGVVLPTLALASGISGSVTVTVTPVTPGKYDKGELLLSYNGTLVATQSLDATLAQGGTVTLTGLPSGTPSSLYYATVRAWNSGAPQAVQNQSYPSAIDLRSNTSGAIELTVN